ncbi:hypothetical protein Goari_013751 [Gossypium aridum]|uniref:Uncharacterized protein n=1 Tax=Gossypium aridum TaxID=34290 RepID=A0A7J8XFR9_GOSAI|nr:hypothetical protein [Gossypium aridum]
MMKDERCFEKSQNEITLAKIEEIFGKEDIEWETYIKKRCLEMRLDKLRVHDNEFSSPIILGIDPLNLSDKELDSQLEDISRLYSL